VAGRGESYRPRQPEQTVLYRVLAENLETFRTTRHAGYAVSLKKRKLVKEILAG
jgi:hypothetical protein